MVYVNDTIRCKGILFKVNGWNFKDRLWACTRLDNNQSYYLFPEEVMFAVIVERG
jgi:hypothetical protein